MISIKLTLVLLGTVVLTACGSSDSDTEPTLFSTWDLANSGTDGEVPVLQPQTRMTIPPGTRDVALSPNGSQLALARIVGRPVFSPDGQRMAFSWYSSTTANSGLLGTRIVDTDTLQYTGEEFPTEDGEILVLGDDFHVGLQEADFFGELVIMPGSNPVDSSLGSITADPGARVLASKRPDYSDQGDDTGIRLITLPDGIVIGDAFETDDDLRAFSADSSTIAVANEATIDVYTLESRTMLTALPVE